ncbi:hypothetical protein [Thermicanus aegyptius]|uniref:hypothetical protein n=1 Tax=Thermicanus aegyptius TaxID=94009 RepID=UPI0004264860|nr:hypothetical protein [Thermicanus aegyptius]
MEYKSIYDNLSQIKTDLMDSINQVQKRARVRLLDEADVEWAIEKMKKHQSGKIELIGGAVSTAYKYRAVSTFVQFAFLRRKEKTAVCVKVTRKNVCSHGVITRRRFKELPLISYNDCDIMSLYECFVGLKRQIRVIRYIFFRKVREKIRNVLKQWEFVLPFHRNDFLIETAICRRGCPLVVIRGSEINNGKYVMYFILPKPYGSFRFEGWIFPAERKIEEIFKNATGEKIPETPEEIAAILTMTKI